MSNTVYLLGAGFNQAIKDDDGLSPPLINNFFQIASKSKKFPKEHYTKGMQIVYDYIRKYWHKDRDALVSTAFDLEECFTMLEYQFREALDRNDKKRIGELHIIQFKLKSFVAKVLSDFQMDAYFSDILNFFGELLYREKPFILTFNYDCFIEGAIEHASGGSQSIKKLCDEREKWSSSIDPKIFDEVVRNPSIENQRVLARTIMEDPFRRPEIPREELANSNYNWNKPLGYGIQFDYIQLQQPGIHYVKGSDFYSHTQDKLYTWPILKLHGSLNWFRYLPLRKYPTYLDAGVVPLSNDKKNEVILAERRWWFDKPPDLNGLYIDPIIITPELNKEKYFQDPLYNRVFSPIWKKAKEFLSNCKKLIVIGYSFPATDFPTKKLFLEAFSENSLKELIIVNPNTSIVQKVKNLTHFENSVTVCENLEEFLRL